jgi:hypothetical protein
MEGDENEAICTEGRVGSKRFQSSRLQSLRLARDGFQRRSVTASVLSQNHSLNIAAMSFRGSRAARGPRNLLLFSTWQKQ